MPFDAQSLTTLYIFVFNIVLTGFFLESLRRAGASSTVRVVTGTTLGIWLAVLYVTISTQSLFPKDIGSIPFFAAILAVVAGYSAFFFLTPLRTALLNINQEYLQLMQGLRVFFGVGFAIEAALNIMPATFGIPDALFHISSAYFAMKAAILMLNKTGKPFDLWFANLFGLLDIVVVAGGIAFFLLSKLGPHHNVMYAALFAAPIFINLHLLSISKLVRGK